MEKWSDRPEPEQDPIDRAMAISSTLFEKHATQAVKFAPPAAGFALFLLYFHTNHFYPSFDLLQFMSLLLGAGMVGFAIIAILWIGLLLPGLWIFKGFVNQKQIKERVVEWMNADERRKTRKVLILIFLLYAGPYCTSTLGLTHLVLIQFGSPIITTGGISLITALLFGVLLQLLIGLPKFSFLRYVYNSWVPIMAINVLALSVMVDSAELINKLEGGKLQQMAIYLVTAGACVVAAVSAMGCFGGLKYSLHFSLFFALMIALYSGVLAGMPERVIQKLGLGNYQAQSILLEADYCTGHELKELPITDGCTLKNVKVVWSLGETMTLRVGSNTEARQVQLPSRFVKAIIRSEK